MHYSILILLAMFLKLINVTPIKYNFSDKKEKYFSQSAILSTGLAGVSPLYWPRSVANVSLKHIHTSLRPGWANAKMHTVLFTLDPSSDTVSLHQPRETGTGVGMGWHKGTTKVRRGVF